MVNPVIKNLLGNRFCWHKHLCSSQTQFFSQKYFSRHKQALLAKKLLQFVSVKSIKYHFLPFKTCFAIYAGKTFFACKNGYCAHISR